MDWFRSWFNTPYYHLLYNNRDYHEAERFITRLGNFLELPSQSKIIDLGCGKGRHSVFLNELGYEVIGLDLASQSIAHNKQFEKDSEPRLKFFVHDMRDEIFGKITNERQDAVFNLFTSFGYFNDTEDDGKVFRSVNDVLNMGGAFVLDFLNETYVRKTLKPHDTAVRGNITFEISKKIEGRFVIKLITFRDRGEEFSYRESVQLYTSEEISSYAERFGFRVEEVWGDYGLAAFDREHSPRNIHYFTKIKDLS